MVRRFQDYLFSYFNVYFHSLKVRTSEYTGLFQHMSLRGLLQIKYVNYLSQTELEQEILTFMENTS